MPSKRFGERARPALLRAVGMIAAILVPLSLSAAGFKNYEIGPRATALGGAFIAGFSDPTSLFYNPASITGLDGTHVHLGGTYTSRRYAFSSSDFGGLALDSERATFPLPEFAVTHRINRFLWAGLGIHSSTNHRVQWPHDRFHPLVYDARLLAFKTWTVTTTLAVKISDSLSIGAGLGINLSSGEAVRHFNYDLMIVLLTNGLVRDPQDFILSLQDCRSTFLSYGLGLQWKITPELHFGFAAEGSHVGEYSVGQFTFREPDTPFEDVNRHLDSIFIDSPEQVGRAYINNIVTVKGGLAWKPSDRLTVEADIYLPIWEMFDTVSVQFDRPMISGTFRLLELEGDFTYDNPVSFRVGAEYDATEKLTLRLGAFQEPSPVPDEQFTPSFPFTDQWGLSAGLGWKFKNGTAGIAYRFLSVSGRSVRNDLFELDGLTDLNFAARGEHLFSIGFNYRF